MFNAEIVDALEDTLSQKFSRKVEISSCQLMYSACGGEKNAAITNFYENYLEKNKNTVRVTWSVPRDENCFAHGGIDEQVFQFLREFNLTPGINFAVHSYNAIHRDGVLYEKLVEAVLPPHIIAGYKLNIL